MDEDLHNVRIRAKRARYAAEAAAPVWGKPARKLASAVAGVQTVLGDLQDAVVTDAWLRRVSDDQVSVAEAFVAGELVGHAAHRDGREPRRVPRGMGEGVGAQAPFVAALVPEVRAAGGVVSRHGGKDIMVIHRPKYDDWSLPKGKAENGESDEDCAVREVAEETGFVCTLGHELPTIRYVDRRGRFKEVRYWAMEPVSGELQKGNDEVDVVKWVSVAQAYELLSYVHDREVVAAWAAERDR